VIPVAPFSWEPTKPFGVPEVVSASFWGGVWGIVFALTLPRSFHGLGYWLASAIIGGLALTLVYMFVVVPLKTGTLPSNMGGLFIIGFILNAAWGIGWALLVLMVFFGLQWNLEPTQNSPAGRSEWVCPDAFRSLVAL
jgi:hypothetical protein